jgi:hypothetical protein
MGACAFYALASSKTNKERRSPKKNDAEKAKAQSVKEKSVN